MCTKLSNHCKTVSMGMMQRVAAERGQGAALNSARAATAIAMQTFRDISGPNHSGSPIAEALYQGGYDTPSPHYYETETAALVRSSLVRFGDDVHGAAAIMDNLRSQVRDFDNIKPTNIPKAPAPPKVTEGPAYPSLKARPELKTVSPPKPPEIAPRKTLGVEDAGEKGRIREDGKRYNQIRSQNVRSVANAVLGSRSG